MAMTLESIVPWGRSFDEYRRMFALGEAELGSSILGCGDGPAAFNAVLSGKGGRVVSCDPLYSFSAAAIAGRIEATSATVLAQADRNRADYLWDRFASPAELGRERRGAMELFLADFEAGLRAGRYLPAALPQLPFTTGTFDLALCSHLLFLYSEQLSLPFHLAALRELCRVADEVRIFPLLDLAGRRSSHLEPVAAQLESDGWKVAIRPVPYEFQRGAFEMLQIRRGVGDERDAAARTELHP